MITLRKVQLYDAIILYNYLSNPCVSQYSRLKPSSIEEMGNMINYLLEEENKNRLIARVIVNDELVVGLITLWDYNLFRREGFLATLIGENHWGKGYNQIAKELFFNEVFTLQYLERIYLLIRNYNSRSIAACKKLHYIRQLEFYEENELREFYQEKISQDHLVFCIDKERFVANEASL